MEKGENEKPPYDLEERTFLFAKRVRAFLKTLPRHDHNVADGRQLLRCSGSVGANYIEANEALGKFEAERQTLVEEATELLSIFSTIIRKSE